MSELDGADLTGARVRRVRLTGARLRLVDLSGAVLRDVGLAGAAIDTEPGQLDGLTINGVAVAPLIEAELARRAPARALVRAAADPAGLRAAWSALERSWAATVDRVAALPAGVADVSVEEEWSFARTLRHLVFVADAWLGAIVAPGEPCHPWGVPFTDLPRFLGRPAATLGIDQDAAPSYADVLALRADRVAAVRAFLADVTPARLADEVAGPAWEHGRRLSVLRCLRVILTEECEHHRFAERDLALLTAAGAGSASMAPSRGSIGAM